MQTGDWKGYRTCGLIIPILSAQNSVVPSWKMDRQTTQKSKQFIKTQTHQDQDQDGLTKNGKGYFRCVETNQAAILGSLKCSISAPLLTKLSIFRGFAIMSQCWAKLGNKPLQITNTCSILLSHRLDRLELSWLWWWVTEYQDANAV